MLEHCNQKTAIVLMGPTASGKTNLAIALSNILPIEIINVDSAQVYLGMDLGTNKPSKSELAATKHHLIDLCLPNQPYSVAKFCQDSKILLEQIHARGNIPVLVGGTMLYFYGLCYGLTELPSANIAIRQELYDLSQKHGTAYLHAKLNQVDPMYAAKVQPHDSQRIQRALEVFKITGQPYSSYLGKDLQGLTGWNLQYFAIAFQERELLHQIIATRFYNMLQQGLLAEVAWLLQQNLDPQLPAMRCVGYKQLIEYLQNRTTKGQAYAKAIAATRQLAKRQYTWLKKWQNLVTLHFLDPRTTQTYNLKLIQSKIKC